jgi:hypothetical protein
MKKNNREKFKSEIERNEKIFREFFDEYYSKNKNVKSISYRTMSEGEGFSAVIDWGSFVQYVNYYCEGYDSQSINSCFELEASGQKFLCHFADILDELMSEDLSFYTYNKCIDKERIIAALNGVMNATEKYYNSICKIASSKESCASVFDEVFCDDIDAEDIPCYPEEAFDFNYFSNGIISEPQELKRELERKNRKNKLETKFEKRAYKVLSKESSRNLKTQSRKRNKAREYPFKYRALAALPYIVFAVIFMVCFYFIGFRLDALLFKDCFGRNHTDGAWAFSAVGAVLGLGIGHLLRFKVSKALYKKNYELIESIYNAQLKGEIFIIGVLFVALAAMLFAAGFGGIAFRGENVVLKNLGFSPIKEYSFSDVEIARIKGYDGDTNDEFAFKIEGEWVEYAADSDETISFIEESITKNNKEVKSYEAFEDIE